MFYHTETIQFAVSQLRKSFVIIQSVTRKPKFRYSAKRICKIIDIGAICICIFSKSLNGFYQKKKTIKAIVIT